MKIAFLAVVAATTTATARAQLPVDGAVGDIPGQTLYGYAGQGGNPGQIVNDGQNGMKSAVDIFAQEQYWSANGDSGQGKAVDPFANGVEGDQMAIVGNGDTINVAQSEFGEHQWAEPFVGPVGVGGALAVFPNDVHHSDLTPLLLAGSASTPLESNRNGVLDVALGGNHEYITYDETFEEEEDDWDDYFDEGDWLVLEELPGENHEAIDDSPSDKPCGCVSPELVGDVKTILDSVSTLGREYDTNGIVQTRVSMVQVRLDDLAVNRQIVPSVKVAGTMCDVVNAMNSAYDIAAGPMRELDMTENFKPLLPPPTVEHVEVELLQGRWYQVASSRLVQWTLQHGARCVAHDLQLQADGTLQLRSSTQEPFHGTLHITVANVTQHAPGKFRLEASHGSSCVLRPLWVIGLGPVVNGQYDWAVLGGPFRMEVVVVARDTAVYRMQYKDTVRRLLSTLGYSHYLSRPLRTAHDASCVYADPPPPAALAATDNKVTEMPKNITYKPTTTTETGDSATTAVPGTAVAQGAFSDAGGVVQPTVDTNASVGQADGMVRDMVGDASADRGRSCLPWIIAGCVLGALLLLACCALAFFWRRPKSKTYPVMVPRKSGCAFCGRNKCHHNEEGIGKELWNVDNASTSSLDQDHTLGIPTYTEVTGKSGFHPPQPAAHWR